MRTDKSHPENYSPEEEQFIATMRQNPGLQETISSLMVNFNAEVGKGMNELEAELMITEMTKTIGTKLVQDWASQSEQEGIKKAQSQSTHPIRRGKKKSTGIPPLDA